MLVTSQFQKGIPAITCSLRDHFNLYLSSECPFSLTFGCWVHFCLTRRQSNNKSSQVHIVVFAVLPAPVPTRSPGCAGCAHRLQRARSDCTLPPGPCAIPGSPTLRTLTRPQDSAASKYRSALPPLPHSAVGSLPSFQMLRHLGKSPPH